ncbi:MAG: hypothetical protein U5L10_05915 [Candidatus Moranbacteria bacterium]|nr:hypothetical protein [Candidatus Moranbacteria bacterium]
MENKPLYLFVCIENACRSQMAQGLFNSLTKKAIAESAGVAPAKEINPIAIEMMTERNIDISEQYPKMITPEMTVQATKIITMGCIDKCPFTPAEKTIEWNIPDPKGKNKVFFVEIRNLIEEHINKLLKDGHLI